MSYRFSLQNTAKISKVPCTVIEQFCCHLCYKASSTPSYFMDFEGSEQSVFSSKSLLQFRWKYEGILEGVHWSNIKDVTVWNNTIPVYVKTETVHLAQRVLSGISPF